MTKDEILRMEAGREMDALVATKVMGWEDDPEVPYWDARDVNGQVIHVSRRWSPSTDIAAAWEVFEFLSKNSVEVAVSCNGVERATIGHDSDGWSCSVWWFKDIESSHAIEGIYADTAPLAICKAALLAVMDL